jgi:hypothetical protein
MKHCFIAWLVVCSFLAKAADKAATGISLNSELSKTEFHHLQPVTVRLKVNNHGNQEFVMTSSMVCSGLDTKICFGDSSTTVVNLLSGGVVIPPGKTQEILLPDRTFPVGEYKISFYLNQPGFLPIKSNEVFIKIRKATKQEASIWLKECYDIYEQLKMAKKSGNQDTEVALYNLLFYSRFRCENIFTIPIMTKILNDDMLAMENSEKIELVHSLWVNIANHRKNKERLEEYIDMKFVISTALECLYEKKKMIVGFDLVICDLEPWMSSNDKKLLNKQLKEIICKSNNELTAWLAFITFLRYFPEEYEWAEKTGVPAMQNYTQYCQKEAKRQIELIKHRMLNEQKKE